MSFWPTYVAEGLQDGYSLREYFDGTLGAEISDLDDIEPGQTVTLSESYKLSSDSPIAFVIYDDHDTMIGKIFAVQP